ncbi:large ribosomal subunit protein bL20-like [Tubulanus polymorphus]|uniref:large ribosomal subunit protein bL20-like n=1 Tax=Tubulanus polymorphus TaxID=672921 RepID=UPI003DA31AEF
MVFLTFARFGRIPHRTGRCPKPDRFWKTQQLYRMTWRFHNRPRNVYKLAVTAARRAMKASTMGRRSKKTYHSDLWKLRISAGAGEHGLNYEQFLTGLSESNILLSRKVLAELAMFEPRTFKSLADIAKQHHIEQGITIEGMTPPAGVVTRGMLNTPIVPGNKNLYPY